MQKAPVSFRRRFLPLIYTFLSYLSIFYRYHSFRNLKSLFYGSQNYVQSLAWPRYYRPVGTFYQPCDYFHKGPIDLFYFCVLFLAYFICQLTFTMKYAHFIYINIQKYSARAGNVCMMSVNLDQVYNLSKRSQLEKV